ncbi:MAG: DUF3365 domain-containing protein [Pseudomonadota bacterium]
MLIMAAILVSLYYFKAQVLRNEAQAVASQVVSFRSWVAGSGMVWVDNLSKDFHDFLAKRPDSNGNFYFGKNPALATRELSELANKSAIRATFRVTSNDYRQPANAPDEFETVAMEKLQGDKEKKYIEGFETGSYRYVQPIYVKKNCLKCHGDPEDAPAEVIEKYGAEKAFGYKEGDVRGVISVKLPDLKILDIAPALVNPFTIGLILLAFVMNLAFTQFSLIKRLRSLTASVANIAEGELETELKYTEPDKSKDEVDHVAHAIDLLRNSLRVAMRHLNNGN